MLDCDKIRADERYIVLSAKYADDTAMVNARDQNGEQVGKESGLLLQIEREGLKIG